MPSSKKSIKKTFKRYYRVTKKSPAPIRPEDVSVSIQTSNTPNPSFVALAILWAHFQACKQGMLKDDEPAPWMRIREERTSDYQLWTKFLRTIIKDTTWISWIENPDEVRKRAIKAYNQAMGADE